MTLAEISAELDGWTHSAIYYAVRKLVAQEVIVTCGNAQRFVMFSLPPIAHNPVESRQHLRSPQRQAAAPVAPRQANPWRPGASSGEAGQRQRATARPRGALA